MRAHSQPKCVRTPISQHLMCIADSNTRDPPRTSPYRRVGNYFHHAFRRGLHRLSSAVWCLHHAAVMTIKVHSSCSFDYSNVQPFVTKVCRVTSADVHARLVSRLDAAFRCSCLKSWCTMQQHNVFLNQFGSAGPRVLSTLHLLIRHVTTLLCHRLNAFGYMSMCL